MIEEFPLIEVSGTPYQLGYQHGSQAKGLVQKYLTWIEKLTGQSRDILVQRTINNLVMILPLKFKDWPMERILAWKKLSYVK